MNIPNEHYIPHETKMCYFNDIPHLVSYKVVHKCEHHEVIIENEGRKNIIKSIQDQGNLKGDDFFKLLKAIGTTIQNCRLYFLDPTHIIFDSQRIYIGEKGYMFEFVPSTSQSVLAKSLATFFDSLQGLVNTEDNDIIEKLHQIRMALREEQFDQKTFLEDIIPSRSTL